MVENDPLTSCPFCGRSWKQHLTRCPHGVPAVWSTDDRGLAGRVISGYGIIGRIGEGGMGTVYLAVDNIKEGQLDAVKVLNRAWVADRERLRREAITANRVDHPNVCKIYNYVEAHDADSGEALTLIAMELVRGPTLREIQDESGGVLELNRAALVVREMAEALHAIHSNEIVHRDIKPTNVIVTGGGTEPERVKIVDFGIAKKVGGGKGHDLTEPGMVAATVHYASPEQLRGKPEERSDIYAMGVVFYELLTGRRPFEAETQGELFSMILDPAVSAPKLEEVSPGRGFPPALQPVIDRALEKDPSNRYGTAREFSKALAGLVPAMAQTVRVPTTLPDLPGEAGSRPPHRGATSGRPPSNGPPPGRPAPSAETGNFWNSPRAKWGSLGVMAILLIAGFFGIGGFGLFSGEAGLQTPAPPGGNPAPVATDSGGVATDSGGVATDTGRQDSTDTGGLVPGQMPADTSETQTPMEVPETQPPPSVRADPTEQLCPSPVLDVLDGLEAAMDDPDSSAEEIRRTATACWDRGEGVGDRDRAYAAWLIGLATVSLDGCSTTAVQWLRRAVRLDSRSQAYQVALDGCGG